MMGNFAVKYRNQLKIPTRQYDKHICLCACLRAWPMRRPPCGQGNHNSILSVSEAVRWDCDQSDVMGLRPAGAPCWPTGGSVLDTAALYKQPLTHLHASLTTPQVWISQLKLTKHEYPTENIMKAARSWESKICVMQSMMLNQVSGKSSVCAKSQVLSFLLVGTINVLFVYSKECFSDLNIRGLFQIWIKVYITFIFMPNALGSHSISILLS